MKINNSVPSYYTPYKTNTSVAYCAGFTKTEEGMYVPKETTENPGFAEFVDYQEFHKAWMSQGAETAFSYTRNEGYFAQENRISLVPGMSVQLQNGFQLVIDNYMVRAMGDYTDNMAASESAAIAGALSHLIKVANGQIPMNMFYSKNQDSSAYAKMGLQAFGIDTSRSFIINGKTFHFDDAEQIRLGSGTEETDIDFSRFAPNSPEKVRKAFAEAAEVTGYYEYSGKGKMDYISQLLVKQVENRQNGVANYTDVFGSSIASALQAAREILYDLENPLMPVSQRGENAAKYIEQEKAFYRAFIERLEESTGAEIDAEETVDYAKVLEEKINEIFVKIQNGDTEPTYQIGSQSFTEKEWDELMEKFDSTTCMYETANPKEDGLRYITWYTEEGIFCRKAGQTGEYEWIVPLENKEQYEKVMNFIGQFPSDWNMRFAAHENFWNDFLNDEIDKDKMQWAKYTNPLDVRFYTAEEMHRMQAAIIAANEAKLTKLTDWDAYEADYKKSHPGYNGEKYAVNIRGNKFEKTLDLRLGRSLML